MNRLIKAAAAAIGLSFFATAAMACSGDGCCCEGKDGKSGKMECCDKMKGKGQAPAKPQTDKPAAPEQPHEEHQH